MASDLTIITTTCDQFVTDQQCGIESPLIDKGFLYYQDSGIMDFFRDYDHGDKQVGFINTNGEDLFFTEDCLLPFHGDFAGLGTCTHWRLIDREFKTVLDGDGYDRIYNYQCGFIRVQIGVAEDGYSIGKWGYLDINGREVIKCQYDDAKDFVGKYAVVAKKRGDELFYGVINSNINVILDFKYRRIEIWEETSVLYAEIGTNYRTKQEEKHLLLNDEGDLLFESPGRYLKYIGHNFFACEVLRGHDKLYRIEDITNRPYKVVKEVDYISKYRYLKYSVRITEFKNGFAHVCNFNDSWYGYKDAFLTQNGDLIPLRGIIRGLCKLPHELYVLAGGEYSERSLDGWGLYDTHGNKRHAFKNKYIYLGQPYFSNGVVSEGLLPFQNEHTGGYIDLDENIIIDDKGKYLYRGEFHDGIASVGIASGDRDDVNRPILLYGFINRNAEIILPFIYEKVYYCDKSNAFLGVIHYEHNKFKGGKHHVIFKSENSNALNKNSVIAQKWEEGRIKQLKCITGNMKVSNSTSLKYLFFDTETIGVPKDYKAPITDLDNWPRLVQLAWILCDKEGKEMLSYNKIIKPNGFTIPAESSNIHKITTEIADAKGVSLNDALKEFVVVAEQANTIIGHNIDFDIKIMGAELLRTDSSFKLTSKPNICTMLKSMNYCAIPSGRDWGDPYKWPKLQELHKKLFGHEFDDAHDAIADVQATKNCFFELKKRNII